MTFPWPRSNLVALYLYALRLPGWASLAIVVVLALLTFVPIRHLYPSQPGLLNRVSMFLGVLWTPLVGWLIWDLPSGGESRVSDRTFYLAVISLIYPIYYLGVSWVISVIHWRKQWLRRQKRA